MSAVRREELPNGFVKYYTGIAVEIPQGYTGFLYPRSSVVKRGLLMANSVGVIDSDFRGEISAVFVKTKDSAEYRLGDRMCQLLIPKTPDIEFEWADELSETDRGEATTDQDFLDAEFIEKGDVDAAPQIEAASEEPAE